MQQIFARLAIKQVSVTKRVGCARKNRSRPRAQAQLLGVVIACKKSLHVPRRLLMMVHHRLGVVELSRFVGFLSTQQDYWLCCAEVIRVNDACCDESSGACLTGVPTECDARCGIVYVDFFERCNEMLHTLNVPDFPAFSRLYQTCTVRGERPTPTHSHAASEWPRLISQCGFVHDRRHPLRRCSLC